MIEWVNAGMIGRAGGVGRRISGGSAGDGVSSGRRTSDGTVGGGGGVASDLAAEGVTRWRL